MGDSAIKSTASRLLSQDQDEMSGKISPDSNQAYNRPRSEGTDSNDGSPSPGPHEADSKPSVPLQKRRRVTRACDECRRKKIKCDGKQPCTHCTVYSYECTYDQPSNRRRNPAPQYIEALEQRLQKSEAILRAVLPGIDIDDPKFDAHSVEQLVEATKSVQKNKSALNSKTPDDPQMQSMVDQAGSLDLDDSGHWDFHGQTSAYHFMRRFRAKFGSSLIPIPQSDGKLFTQSFDSPKSVHSSLFDGHGSAPPDLPPREVALNYCKSAIDDGCALSRPLHRPTFFKRLNHLYDTDSEHWDTESVRFIPLMYAVMAFGCLFARGDAEALDQKGYRNAIENGYQWFQASKSTVDITDCRDLMSIQTVIFMIFFLQSSAKLSTCYSYVGIALRACCRLGMHRNVTANFSAVEQDERRRAFWLIRNLDGYVGTMLGLPQMLGDDDIDQEYPTEVHDDYIVENGIKPMPQGIFPLIKATNAHSRLTFIMRKVLVYIYPLRPASASDNGHTYTIGHSRIKELEKDLQTWMDDLPMELRPSGNAETELSRVQQLLRMSYAYVQIMMYRPFLHYVSPTCQQMRADKRSFACAAACVSVARNIVHITSEMRRRGLLGGAYWFVMYITYFAILSLVYFVLENPESTTSQDILKDAREGHETLVSLSKRSFAADRCAQSLKTLFEELPEKLKERRSSLQTTPNSSRKRAQPSDAAGHKSVPPTAVSRSAPINNTFAMPPRARTLPHGYLSRNIKRNSLPNSPVQTPQAFPVTPASADTQSAVASHAAMNTSPQDTPTLNQYEWSGPQLQQGSFPDLQSVMFPSENPFAYGNQPISTLEDSGAGGFGDMAMFGSDQFNTPSAENNFPTPQSIHNQAGGPRDFEMGGLTGFGNDQLGGPATSQPQPQPQPQPQQHSRFDDSTQMYGIADTSKPSDEYWTQGGPPVQQQQGRMHFRPGTGFSQAPRGVNLDELFGGGQDWGAMNIIDMNMMNGPNNTNPNQVGGWNSGNGGGWM